MIKVKGFFQRSLGNLSSLVLICLALWLFFKHKRELESAMINTGLIKYLVLILIIVFPIFGNLDSIPLQKYDEARVALNAYEMLHDGDFIVTHYEGEPEMWNTKPPLMIWLQVLCMKIFGVGEFAIRLPSAIAAFLTCLFLVFFSVRFLKDFWFGFIASIVLITSVGYMNTHAVRTGDYDSLLTLFTTLYPLLFFIYIDTEKLVYLYSSAVAIILAALTKGIAGMLFLPILLIYTFWQRRAIALIKSRHLYISVGFFVFFVLGYYLLREHYNHGFIKVVIGNELGGRYFTTIENHREDFWFYYRMLVDHHFIYWYLATPCGLIVAIFHKDRIYRLLGMYSSALILFYFFVISLAQTRLEWYNVPLYPFLAIIVALFIHLIFTSIRNSDYLNRFLKVNFLPYAFLIIVTIKPLSVIFGATCSPKVAPWEEDYYRISYYLKDAIKGNIDLNGYSLLQDNYAPQNMFYAYVLNEKGANFRIEYDWKNIHVNDSVIVHQQVVNDYLKQNFSVDTIRSDNSIFLYRIKGRINHD